MVDADPLRMEVALMQFLSLALSEITDCKEAVTFLASIFLVKTFRALRWATLSPGGGAFRLMPSWHIQMQANKKWTHILGQLKSQIQVVGMQMRVFC